jgi:hypothetical protein
MDPVSCIALATGAYKTLRGAISAGDDLMSMGNSLATWGKAVSDFTRIEERQKNPPFWEKTFKGSDEENAILIWNNRRKLDEMRESLRSEISFLYGPSAWEEILRIEAEQRRIRKEAAYKKQEQIDAIINFTIGAVIFVVSGGLLFLLFYFLGKYQGRW